MASAYNSTCTGFNQIIEHIELGLVKCLVICSQGRFVRYADGWFEQLCDRHRECALSAGSWPAFPQKPDPNSSCGKGKQGWGSAHKVRLHPTS